MLRKLFFAILFGFVLIFDVSFASSLFSINVGKVIELDRETIFKYLSKTILKDVPKSYKYISLNFTDLKKEDPNYEVLQKIVWSDLIENKAIRLNLKSKLNSYIFYSLLERKTGYDFVNSRNYKDLKSRNVTNMDLIFVSETLKSIEESNKALLDVFGSQEKIEIFKDVYSTILEDHYDSKKIGKDDLIYSSIAGLAKGSGDKFTTYFPPSESKYFEENLSGEFEGIGAYVDMEAPGELRIISPISGSPAERAGIKSGDIVKKVNGVEITRSTSLKDSINLIRGPVGTKVILEIQRGDQTLIFEIMREKIVLNDVEYKVIDGKYFYIKVRMFGDKVFNEMLSSIDELNKHPEVKNIILDLRNTPGGYLDQAVNLLSLFIKKSQPVVVVRYKNGVHFHNSYGYDKLNLGDYNVYILVNSGTASASEIFAGTLKDYFPDIKIVGENTYGKGSVQNLKHYSDGSSLKYTIAKWYTGKTMTGVDGVGISPDVKVDLDVEKFKKGIDTQLDYVLNLGK